MTTLRLLARTLVAATFATPALALAADEPAGDATLPPLSEEAQAIADELDRTLPAGSEARAMFEDVVSGRPLGPTDGWFKTAVAQTRFDWAAVKSRYDRNADDAVSPEEFAGARDDFDRLDRDGDAAVTELDLNWTGTAQQRDDGMTLFRMTDRNVDGRITTEELSRLFERLDTDSLGFVTLDDVRSAFTRATSGGRGGEGPDREILLKGLIRQEVGSLQAGPALNESAPDFTLQTYDGSEKFTLSEQIGPRPVVLVFGNFTCGPFRGQSGNVEKLFRRYQDRATFLMVYVREAHPMDGWHMESNARVGVSIDQPKTYEERVAVATRCRDHIDFGMPFLVDTIDDAVGAAYSGMPSRLYVIDADGLVAYKSGRGPFGFKPAEMEQALLLLLASDSPAQAAAN